MRVEDLLVFGKTHCHSDHAKILLAELLEKNPLELLNCLEEIVPEDLSNLYQKEVLALESGKPLQYVLGKVNFYGNFFEVDERVLIPRFETEELVEQTIQYINKYWKEPVDILDLGCGSGVIGITLEKKVSTNSVDLIDISKDALEVAEKNAKQLNSKVNFLENDFLSNIQKKYDIIISNPPYIREEEEIEAIVKENEPHVALYAGKEGLDAYEKIFQNIASNMKERCLIALEIGCEQAEKVTRVIQKYLKNVRIEVKKDLSEKDRMIFVFKNLE